MSTILDRITKLVALAESANENEARNAAVQACKLIVQHKVVLMMPGSSHNHVEPPIRNVRTAGGANAPTAEDAMRTGTPVDLGEIFDGLFGKDAGNRFRRSTVESPPAHTMEAPQDGTCRDCGEDFRRGDRIWYRRGVGAVHTMRCNPDILNKKSR
jgi:hypothetical protein